MNKNDAPIVQWYQRPQYPTIVLPRSVRCPK